MGGLAILAKELGHSVSGSDEHVYPPMSTQLEQQGIVLINGYNPKQLEPRPDLVVIGNALSRGNPAVEYVLNHDIPYTSGPQWIYDYLLKDRWVLACAGTHGKTSTSSMLAWILEYAGMSPGFLIGGVPGNFKKSAALGRSDFFVIEADEYDSSFFDKRSKFVHYHPKTLVLNNLEFDHADIFENLQAIQTQFHHLVRVIPSRGLIIYPQHDSNLRQVLDKGCWSNTQSLCIGDIEQDCAWQIEAISADGGHCRVSFYEHGSKRYQENLQWSLIGRHNMSNALAAIAAARHVGVTPDIAVAALAEFSGVKRRLEFLGERSGVSIYDDFAHHPTAIATTLQALRAKVGAQRIFAIIEPRSNTMRMGVHEKSLAASATAADEVLWYQPKDIEWDLAALIENAANQQRLFDNIQKIVDYIKQAGQPGDHVVVMSNGSFAGIHAKLLAA